MLLFTFPCKNIQKGQLIADYATQLNTAEILCLGFILLDTYCI